MPDSEQSASSNPRSATPQPSRSSLLEQIEALDWMSHNIPLGAGRSTIPQQDVLIGDDPRTDTIRRVLSGFHRAPLDSGSDHPRLLDLGSLEGGVALEMARFGYDVLGVEGREENYTKCDLVRQLHGLDNLRFLHADVRDLAATEAMAAAEGNGTAHVIGTFDVIVCCGLLYHLDRPYAFLDQLAAMLETDGILFLDTHIAPDDDRDVAASLYAEGLAELTTHEVSDLPGRWIAERDPDQPVHPWASIGNDRSFWPTKRSLLIALERAGFSLSFEVYGGFPVEQEWELKRQHCRSYFVAVL